MDTDDVLVAELRAALSAADPIPADLVDAAKESFTWRRMDAELAELVSDSAIDPRAVIRADGSSSEPRLLTFRGPGLTVEVEVTSHGESRRVVGQLVPPRSADVEVRWQGGSVSSHADEIGFFSAASVPPGPVSIACRPWDTTAQLVTSWVTI